MGVANLIKNRILSVAMEKHDKSSQFNDGIERAYLECKYYRVKISIQIVNRVDHSRANNNPLRAKLYLIPTTPLFFAFFCSVLFGIASSCKFSTKTLSTVSL